MTTVRRGDLDERPRPARRSSSRPRARSPCRARRARAAAAAIASFSSCWSADLAANPGSNRALPEPAVAPPWTFSTSPCSWRTPGRAGRSCRTRRAGARGPRPARHLLADPVEDQGLALPGQRGHGRSTRNALARAGSAPSTSGRLLSMGEIDRPEPARKSTFSNYCPRKRARFSLTCGYAHLTIRPVLLDSWAPVPGLSGWRMPVMAIAVSASFARWRTPSRPLRGVPSALS